MTIKIKHKRGTASNITSANPTLAAGELAFETDTRRFKVGDGTTAWSSLSYVTPYVTATDRILGRSSAGAGSAEEITCTAAGRALLSGADAAAQRTTLAAAEVNHTHSASDVYVPDNYANFGGADLESVLETIDGALFSGAPTVSPAFTGAATFANTGNVVPLTITNTGTANSFVVNDASGDTTPFVIDANGRVVIGGTAASSEGDVVSVINAAAATGNVSRLFVARASAPSSSTSAHNGFQSSIGTDAASFTVSALRHFIATQGTLGAGSSVTDQYGFAALSTITGATNNYGFYSDIASGTGRWNFYSNGTAPSYFGGQLLVTAGSVSAPGVAFSGDTNTGFYSPAADQVAVTTNGILRFYTDSPTNRSRIIVNRQDQSLVLGSYWESGVGQNSYISSTNTALTGDSSLLLQTGTTTRLTIGFDGSLTAPDVYGDTVGATNRDLFIDSGGLIGYVSSIRASKTNIAAIEDVSWLRDLTPVSFHYRKRNEDGTYSDEADGTLDYGLIAEEVEPVAPEMCFYDVVDGEPQLRGVHYSKLITPMLRYIQQLEQRIAALEERVNA